MSRPRKPSAVRVEHRPKSPATSAGDREAFEQRERARGLAPRAGEPVRKAPSRPADSAVRRFIDRGFSEEMAREMAEQCVPHDVRSRWGGDQQL